MKATHPFKKVMVTGGAGCIGMAVCKDLLERGLEIHLLDLPEQIFRVKQHIPPGIKLFYGSILDRSMIREAIEGCDAIIHLAGFLGVRRTEVNKLRCLEINIDGTKNILDCAVQHGIRKITFASSSEVYGEPPHNPITERTPTQGKTVYAVSKMAGEELCKAYAQRYPQLGYTVCRYFNAYGSFQTAQFVIPKFVRNVLRDEPPVIYGSGKQIRSYAYSEDTARMTVSSLLYKDADGETINVGRGDEPISLVDLAELVVDVAGKSGKIKPTLVPDYAKTDRVEGREIYERFCDSAKARDLLGLSTRVSLREGLQRMLESGVIFDKWDTVELSYMQEELL